MSKRVLCVILLRLVVFLPCLGHAVVSWPHNIIIARGGAASESLDDDDDDPRKKLPLHGLQPDKFVSLAPLIVAAVCSDGIVMIATHTSYLQEPLLMRLPDNSQDNSSFLEMSINTTDTAINSTQQQNTSEAASNVTLPRDVPLDFRGPFRIQSIDSVGSTLLCAGWKTDGDWLTQTCRDLAESEIANFGPPTTGSGYGRYIANEASFWMAQCAVSDQVNVCRWLMMVTLGMHSRTHIPPMLYGLALFKYSFVLSAALPCWLLVETDTVQEDTCGLSMPLVPTVSELMLLDLAVPSSINDCGE
jgi:hypothetical protein